MLRRHRIEDLEPLVRAVNESLDHLRPWMVWAQEPATARSIGTFLSASMAAFEEGADFGYVILDAPPVSAPPGSGPPGSAPPGSAPPGSPDSGDPEGGILGGCGLHDRLGPDALEIGYWVHARHLRRGIASRAAWLLTTAAFALPGIERVEIHCDASNTPSAGVPARLGYRLDRIEPRAHAAPADTDRQMVWVIDSPDHLRSPT